MGLLKISSKLLMTELVCDHKTLFSQTISMQDKCTLLAQTCRDDQEIFNFFKLYTCYLNGNNFIFILLAVLLIILLFKFICAVVEDYIAPAIVYLSKYLQLSEALAGVTLLAFANGAGDVITAIVAADSKEGISYNIGALYGAGLFVVTLVVAITIKNSPNAIIVNKSVIYRDIGFYIIATLMTLMFALIGRLTVLTSLAFLGLYLMLVIVVMIQDSVARRKGIRAASADDEENDSILHNEEIIGDKKRRFSEIFSKLDKEQINKLKSLFDQLYNYVKHKARIREPDQGIFATFLDKVDYPFMWLRKLTMPPVEPEDYDHKYTIIWPLLGIPFLVWATTLNPQKWWLLLIPVSLALSLTFKIFKPKNESSLPSYFMFMIIFGLINGILWTNLLCGLLVDLLTVIGVITNLSSTYLGLTILAVGNALPDGLTTIAIAKQGKAIMGITGGIAGQVFGLLVGFGVAMLKKTLFSDEIQTFDLFNPKSLDKNILSLIVIFVALFSLVFIFIYGITNNLRFDKRLANILIFIYLSLIAVTTTIAVYQAIQK